VKLYVPLLLLFYFYSSLALDPLNT
jgi:hypothetical protein